MKKKHKQKGFTLLEVTLALVLFSILLIPVFMMFEDSYSSYINFQNKVDLLENSRMVTEFIQEEIRLADYVELDRKEGTGVAAAPESTLRYDYLTRISLKEEEVDHNPTGRNILVLHVNRELKAPDEYSGNKEITYQGVVIADNVRHILIKELQNPRRLEIECTLEAKLGASREEAMTSKLLISLEYKTAPIV